MTELGAIFAELGISQYHDVFVEQGFDTWDTILDITESDFDALGVKLGHRRKLQRRIKDSKNTLAERSNRASTDERHSEDRSLGKGDGKDGSGNPGKRKYRRHPKPDENAPERPPSAYVIFSNKMRDDLKGRHLTFTEIAKLVGEHWQNLSPDEKEPYEAKALAAKEKFNNEMTAYKKTESFRDYTNYLVEFKAKQANQANQQQNKLPQPPSADTSKRPKLEARASTASNSTASSAATTGSDGVKRGDSGSSTGMWAAVSGPMVSAPFAPTSTAAASPLSRTAASLMPTGMIASKLHASPAPLTPAGSITPVRTHTTTPTTTAPTYSLPLQAPQPMSWKEVARDTETPGPGPQLPSINNLADIGSRSNSSSTDPTNYPTMTGSDRRSISFVPSLPSEGTTGSMSSFAPSLRSETTTGSMSSVASKFPSMSSEPSSAGSGSMYPPHIPMEPSLDRSMSVSSSGDRPPRPMTSYFSGKPGGKYENQLPPLLPPMSPPSGITQSHQSPTDYPSQLQPMRGYSVTSSKSPPMGGLQESGPHDPPVTTASTEQSSLDPFSALLRAGEIVDRNSKRPLEE